MSFSLSKSYLSTVAGLALDHGHHLLQQTSEWTGALWANLTTPTDKETGF